MIQLRADLSYQWGGPKVVCQGSGIETFVQCFDHIVISYTMFSVGIRYHTFYHNF